MTLNFKRISEARQHLTDSGYVWHGYGNMYGNPGKPPEVYTAGPLMAFVRKVPFKGVQVRII